MGPEFPCRMEISQVVAAAMVYLKGGHNFTPIGPSSPHGVAQSGGS